MTAHFAYGEAKGLCASYSLKAETRRRVSRAGFTGVPLAEIFLTTVFGKGTRVPLLYCTHIKQKSPRAGASKA